MITHTFPVLGELIPVYVPQTIEDFQAFQRYVIGVANSGQRMAYDTETTGLDTFSPGFRIRTAQFGTPDQAWVLQVEKGDDLRRLAAWALRTLPELSMQNRNFDMLATDRHLPGRRWRCSLPRPSTRTSTSTCPTPVDGIRAG